MHKLSYYHGTTIAHRLYPLTKFGWLLAGTIILFIIQDGRLLMFTSGVCAVALFWINRQMWKIRGFRLVVLTGIILCLLYLLFEKSGQVIINPRINILKMTTGGILLGLRFSGRFLSIVFMSYLFILTTDPSDLAFALMKIGLPYRYGFMLVTALRLAPVMEDEGRTIYQAQLTRGIRYDKVNLRSGLMLVQQFMTPLLISALRRADKLVFSMEGRGFGKQSARTFRARPSVTYLDGLINLGLVLYFGFLLYLNYGRFN